MTNPDLKTQLREAAEAEERESYDHRMSESVGIAVGFLLAALHWAMRC